MLVWPCAYEVPLSLVDENMEKELKIWVGVPRRKSDERETNFEDVVYWVVFHLNICQSPTPQSEYNHIKKRSLKSWHETVLDIKWAMKPFGFHFIEEGGTQKKARWRDFLQARNSKECWSHRVWERDSPPRLQLELHPWIPWFFKISGYQIK